MIVLFSVVQRVAWYERSRPDCFFSIVFNLGVFFRCLFFFSSLFLGLWNCKKCITIEP